MSKNGFILPLCALGYTALILILWGPGSIEQSPVAAQSLSLTKLLEGTPALILLLLLAGGMTFFLLREKSGERLKKLCLYVAAGWILVNGACRYTLLNASQTGCMQVDELLELIDGRNYLYLNTFPDNWTVAGKLNAATEKDPGHVDINFFMNHMWSPPGVYTPYIPEPARGTIPDRETPDTGVLVLDFTAYRMITFAENVKTVYSPDLMLCAAEYTPGERLADSMLANIWNLVLSAGKPGILALFSPELSSSPVKVSFCIETDTETEMSIRNGTESYIVPLHPGQEWYEIDFGSAASAMNFSVSDTDIRVLEYRVEPIGQ